MRAPALAILTAPPAVAREVTPVESNVDTEVSPVTFNVLANVTTSATLRVPFTVVRAPALAILTAPPAVAREVTQLNQM